MKFDCNKLTYWKCSLLLFGNILTLNLNRYKSCDETSTIFCINYEFSISFIALLYLHLSQGFVVALFFCYMNGEVRKFLIDIQ